ncbi:MAG: M1 family metallopeptidase [Bryobacterales bacterium]|nr:M1 family metallopeptidase [Bryobacterales bacterium]
MRAVTVLLAMLMLGAGTLGAQRWKPGDDIFRQLDEVLPTPNEYRTASGAPGHRYWQQKVDYDIRLELDDTTQSIQASEAITYHNQSPDTLHYLWLQLDQNRFKQDSHAKLTQTAPSLKGRPSYRMMEAMLDQDFDGGHKILAVKDAAGKPLPYVIQDTMMRIDLPQPLRSGERVQFSVDWRYNIVDVRKIGARGGYEYFKEDGNYLYEIAQWFPRMAAYTDYTGWQHKQFLGAGEFTLEFGDYKVAITVPDDHIVGATGVLQNPNQVLSATHRQRLQQARGAAKPVLIVTPDEAIANEKSKPSGKKTWIFHAENVRDFAFASSRKFIWDAQEHDVEGNKVMAMSYYPKEGNPLWERYSTRSIIHTLNVYSRYSFKYPYPTAISVNGPVGGMEYPMICFNGPRPEKDGTYSDRTKYGLISVIIHEVGHNFFPMIVNSDERQWTWMDEGLNTFLQYLSEQEWEEKYPSRRGEPKEIVDYMTSQQQEPIMTQSDSVLQLGPNAYAKPATALNILRETILGRELFDFAFREYSRRWMFKRPMPADFFRTMEDSTGVDLDWFWRAWFYTTDHVDISLESLEWYTIDTKNPEIEKPRLKKLEEEEPVTLSKRRNEPLPKFVDQYPELLDFYNNFDKLNVTAKDREDYQKFLKDLEDNEKAVLNSSNNFFVMTFKNLGGVPMPVILDITFTDGARQQLRIPAEIWRRNRHQVSKLLITPREIQSIVLDPNLETADANLNNNHWPPKPVKTRFQIFKEQRQKNPMQIQRELEKVTQQ